MLILSRKKDESIMLGDEIKVTVLGLRGGNVRIGITAPASITVHREEIYEAIKAEQARSKGKEQLNDSQNTVFDKCSKPYNFHH